MKQMICKVTNCRKISSFLSKLSKQLIIYFCQENVIHVWSSHTYIYMYIYFILEQNEILGRNVCFMYKYYVFYANTASSMYKDVSLIHIIRCQNYINRLKYQFQVKKKIIILYVIYILYCTDSQCPTF